MLLRTRTIAAVLGLGVALLSPAAEAADAPSGRLFYVTHALSHDIATFRVGQDGSPERVGELVKTGDGTGPASILFAPDGRTAYVTNRTVSEIAAYRVGSGGELTLLAAEPTGGMTPFGLAIAPDGTSLFAANLLSDTVTAFTINADGTLKRAGDPVPTGFTLPRGLGVSPDGRFLYVGHGMPTLPGPDVIVRFAIRRDGTLRRVGRPVPTNPAGAGMVFTPDGRFLYVATQFEAKVDGFRVGRDGDLTPVPGSPFNAAVNAEGAAIAPDGRHLFIAGPGNEHDPGAVSAYAINGDGSLTEVTGSPSPAGQGPVGIDTTPDGRRLLVAGSPGPGLLSAFAIGSDGRLDPITNPPVLTGGTAPRFQSLAVLPNQGPVAALAVEARRVGQATRFDASAATDPDGRVARYDWDFGDGTTLRDGGPVPVHTYRRPGRFTATVTVTDGENCSMTLVFTGTTVHCNGSAQARASQTVTARP
ncbi:beta-propeller fold lactonase family protein [Nonomuraea sp. NPDC048916]|uniref:beta-propeller fold lactonase family protein n=1 Tax=Nonomuraea sp. NPDC048916 TaxID=3154232 RepID=UPI0033D741AD